MKLPGIIRKLTRALGVHAPQKPPATRSSPQSADGFSVAKPKLVDLGKPPSASKAGDQDYVKSLYKELLNREPDPGGFQSHMKGLENGVSREELRQVFLNSPEYRGLQQNPQTQAPKVDQAAPAAPQDTRNTETKWTDFANQNLGGAWTGGAAIDNPVARAARLDLGSVAEKYNAAMGGHAVAIGDDKLDFRDGRGPVDVIRALEGGGSQFWFGSPQGGQPNPVQAPTGTIPGAGPAGAAPAEPGPALSTVPWNVEPMWSQISPVTLPKGDPNAAALEAAKWVRQNKSELLPLNGRPEDRAKMYQAMTWVIGLLRANGYDATRVVNHPTLPMTDPVRVGSDAVALNGRTLDLFRASTEPQILDVGPADKAERQ